MPFKLTKNITLKRVGLGHYLGFIYTGAVIGKDLLA